MFCNPYGVRGVLYIYYSYNKTLTSLGIQELQNLDMSRAVFYMVLIICIVCFVNLYRYAKNGKMLYSSDVYMFLGSVLILVIFHCVKNYIFVGIGSYLLIAYFCRDAKVKKIIPRKTNKYSTLIIWIVCIICGIYLVVGNIGDVTKWTEDYDTQLTPAKAVAYMQKHGGGNKVYTEFGNGGYFEYMGYKVFIDARPELYFKKMNHHKDTINDYLDFRFCGDRKKIDSLMEHYDFDYMCVSKNEPMECYLSFRDDIKPVVETDEYTLYKVCKER